MGASKALPEEGKGHLFAQLREIKGGLYENAPKALPEEGKGGRGALFAQSRKINGAIRKRIQGRTRGG